VVPVALLGTFATLLAMGFSINVLTMFGMVLVIGIVVDDAIVVVENVERIMSEEGLPPLEATRKAMGQISGAIIGVTVVLISVFVPLAFFSGSVGNIYRQFAAVMGVSIAFSALHGAVAHACAVRHLAQAGACRPPPRQDRLLRLVQPRLLAHRQGVRGAGWHAGSCRAPDAPCSSMRRWWGRRSWCTSACPRPSCPTKTRAP
jgi:multidrug efflux pump subunit AcrB